MSKTKNPNFLHYAGLALLLVGCFLLLHLKLVAGFSAWFIGCGIGLLGCELERLRSKKTNVGESNDET